MSRARKKSDDGKPSSLEAALAHLPGAKQQKGKGEWMAPCPGHHDPRQSLSVSLRDAGSGQQRLLLHCFAGCSGEAILSALKLENWAAFTFPKTNTPSSPERKNGTNGTRTVGAGIPLETVATAHAVLLAGADATGFGKFGNAFQRLRKRGFTRATIERALLGQLRNVDAIPYFKDGVPTYLKMRRALPDARKQMWIEPREDAPPFHLYNLDALTAAPDDCTAIVAEGEYDALTFGQLDLPGCVAVSLPAGTGTATLPAVVEPLRRFKHVALALDNDRPGNTAAKELALALGPAKCLRLTFGKHKDANEALQALGDDALRAVVVEKLNSPEGVEEEQASEDIAGPDPESRTVEVPDHGTTTVSPTKIVNTLVPMFRGRLVTYSGGAVYERGPGSVCRLIAQPLDEVDAVLRVVGPAGYRLTAETIDKVFRSAIVYAERGATDMIRGVRFNSDTGDCLARIALPVEGNWSAWQEFTDRLNAPKGFKAFVWSIYEPRHGGRQLCWLRGDGLDGKSVVANVLVSSLGGAAGVLDDDRLSGPGRRFALETIWDKRFVSIPNTKNSRLPMNGLIHQLTGLDSMLVEPKGKRAFVARPSVRILATSNEKPSITKSRSNLSRLLSVEVESRGKCESDPTWEPRLVAQLPAFLAECREAYAEVCPTHGDILLDTAATEGLDFAVDEDSLEHMAAELVVRDPTGSVTAAALYERGIRIFPHGVAP